MSEWNWRLVALRWLSLFGIIVPAADSLANTVVGLHRADYNFLVDYISSLGARGQPDSDALCLIWVTFPLLFAPFVIAVYEGLREQRFGAILPFLLELFALFLGLCGIFRFDPLSPYSTFASTVHVFATGLAGGAVFLTPFLLWFITRHDPRWRWVRRFSLVIQFFGSIAALLFALVHFRLIPWAGLVERLFWGVYYVWLVTLALKLRQLGREAANSADPTATVAWAGNGADSIHPHLDGVATANSQASCSNSPGQ